MGIPYHNRISPFLLSAIFLTHILHSSAQAVEKINAIHAAVPVIDLYGNGYQRGLAHGRLLKKQIAEVYKKWKDNIAYNTKQDPDSVICQFYRSTHFIPAIKRWTPDLYDEIKGIAKSSGQSFMDVLCFQLVDEFWVYLDRLEHSQKHHCSGIGISAAGSHHAYIAQNMDLESYLNGYQVLLHIAGYKDVPEQFVLSAAGLIGLNGVNEKSIGVCVNTLMELNACTDGLPGACVIRGILTRTDKPGALRFIQRIKHASGQNYIIGAFDSVYDFEASAGRVVRFLPTSSDYSIVYHTNHALANSDVKPWYEKNHRRILAGELKNDNSVVRYASLEKRLGLQVNELSEQVIKETLRSKDDPQNPVCRLYKNASSGFTFSSVVISLGRAPSIQLTNASPDQSPYGLHTFKNK